MPERLEIRLYRENEETVSLTSLSTEALDSFLTSMAALKDMAKAVISSEELSFSIVEGSAVGAVVATTLDVLYSEIREAMQGNSDDKNVTSNLRVIQNQLQRENFSYNFDFIQSEGTISIAEDLRNIGKIALRRRPRSSYQYKLKMLSGFFNQLGGKDPNYHFDYGDGDKLTIDCNIEQAKNINQYIYTNVFAILLSKEWNSDDRPSEYSHKVIVPNSYVDTFRNYLNAYNAESDIINKLTLTHDLIENQTVIENQKLQILKTLLIAFNDINFHLSELKTLLVISKPYRNEEIIRDERRRLHETYISKRGS